MTPLKMREYVGRFCYVSSLTPGHKSGAVPEHHLPNHGGLKGGDLRVSDRELVVLMKGEVMGWLTKKRDGLFFAYTKEWQDQDNATPLSLSMPVIGGTYQAERVEHWLWGLLPDDERVVKRWAQVAQVPPHDVFGLIAHFGADVAGAVQFMLPERLEQFCQYDEVLWLSEEDLAMRIDQLAVDSGSARQASDPGRFALAGMQAKTALLCDGERWGVPGPGVPTNTIVKLANPAYDGLIENEHFCLRLAAAAGLPASDTRVIQLGKVAAIAVARYDRYWEDGRLQRVHQEDMCQALGRHPNDRYEADGGPGVRTIFGLLDARSSEHTVNKATFFRYQVFNFLIGGTDAHAKNFSLLLDGSEVRLAPLYDVASMLPYVDPRELKLAMRIGKRYDIKTTLPRHWQRLAGETLCVENPIDVLEEMAVELRELAPLVAQQCRADGIDHPIVERLTEKILASCEAMLANISATTASQ